MLIKAYLESGRFKLVKAIKIGDMKDIVLKYKRWEYLNIG